MAWNTGMMDRPPMEKPHPMAANLPRASSVATLALAAALVCACGSATEESGKDDRKRRQREEKLRIEQPEDLARQLEQLSGGAQTKLVWMWHQNTGNTDTYAVGRSHVLAGIDTRDGLGARVILAQQGNYARPMITPDGGAIVYTDKNVDRDATTGVKRYRPVIHRVDWKGENVTALADGYAVDVWIDPETEVQWVYAIRDIKTSAAAAVEGEHLFRFRLDDPGQSEVVWEKTPVTPDNFQLSRSGGIVGALLPWPEAGILDLDRGEFHKTEDGCWASTAPDDSGVTWVFDGQHRNLRMFTKDRQRSWSIDLGKMAPIGGHEVYHPRWSNHAQYFAITGPYIKATEGENVISKGGEDAEVFLCKFNKAYDGVEASVRLTNNGTGDFYPDAWISTGDMSIVSLPEPEDPRPQVEKIPWPPSEEGLVFKWENAREENAVPGADGERRICRVQAHGLARYGPDHGMSIDGGYFVADNASNAAIAEACAASGEVTFEAIITETMYGDFSKLSTRILGYTMGDELALGIYRVQHSLTLQVLLGKGADAREYSVPLGAFHIENDRPFHLVVTVRGDTVSYYVDGFFIEALPQTRSSAAGWRPGQLVMGDPEPINAERWDAEVSGVAIYDRALDTAEVKSSYLGVQQKVGRRPHRTKVRLRARLVEATPLPTPESIDTYQRALVDYTYEVLDIVSGRYKHPKMVVLHWAVLDRKPAPGVPRKVGDIYELVVEPVERHPQLRSERTESGTSEFDLPLYYDATTPGSDPAIGD